MKIKLLATGVIRDCAQDVGFTLIDAGLAEPLSDKAVNDYKMRLVAPNALPFHDVKWGFSNDTQFAEGGMVGPPVIVARCQTCGQPWRVESFKGTACDPIDHFGKQECPAEIVEEYKKLFDAWNKKGGARIMSSAAHRELAGAIHKGELAYRQELAALKEKFKVVTLD